MSSSKPKTLSKSLSASSAASHSDDFDDDSSRGAADASLDDSGTSIRVAVRVRPFTPREVAKGCKCCISMQGNEVTIRNDLKNEQRQFRLVPAIADHHDCIEIHPGVFSPRRI